MTDRTTSSTASREYEWRLTYDHQLRSCPVWEAFGLHEGAARHAMEMYSQNPQISDLRLWRRPKPATWEAVDD